MSRASVPDDTDLEPGDDEATTSTVVPTIQPEPPSSTPQWASRYLVSGARQLTIRFGRFGAKRGSQRRR